MAIRAIVPAFRPEYGRPAAEPLTRQEARALRYITDFLAENTFQPNFREIGAHLGLKSTKQVSELLLGLETKGYVERVGQQSRSVRLLHIHLMPDVVALRAHPASPPSDLPAEMMVDRALIPAEAALYFVVGGAADATLAPGDPEWGLGAQLLVADATGACSIRRVYSPAELAPGNLVHGRVLALLRRSNV
jgi:hypothetical protein